jgi:predicted alpha/beta superfamily hydrolase
VALLLLNFSNSTAQSRDPRGSTIRIYSRALNEQRTLSISLPEDYETSRQAYPVLYVLDAEGTKTFPQCLSTIDDLQSKGTMPPLIAVGIWNTNRDRDMIPVAVSHRPGSGGSERFLTFIREELVPYINKTYRTGDFSILYGMSNSALFAVYALLEEPDTFRAYLASSPMIGHCPEFITGRMTAFIKRSPVGRRILYLIYGTEDTSRVTDFVPDFHDYLKAHAPEDFISELIILEGDGHVPESSLAKGLQFIFSQTEE